MQLTRPILSTLVAFLVALAAHAEERPFDGRDWKVGHDTADSRQRITEYVLPPETVESWSELVTRQVFFDPEHRVQLQQLLDAAKSDFLELEHKDFKWSVLEKTNSDAIYEWSHSGGAEQPAQYEIARLSRCEDGICRWAYTTKRVPAIKSTRTQWRRILAELNPGALPGVRTFMGQEVFDVQLSISGGETLSVPVTKGGPIPAENQDFKIEHAGISIQPSILDPKQAVLAWGFSLTAKSSQPLERVVVEEVYPGEVTKVLVDSNAPALKDKQWFGAAPGVEPSAGSSPWLFTDGNSLFVFRFTISPVDGPAVVLYQPALIPASAKEAARRRALVRP